MNNYNQKSELYKSVLCGKNLILYMINVRQVGCLYGRFLYTKIYFEKSFKVSTKPEFPFVLRSEREIFHSVPVGTEGGELLWSNLLPKSSRG